MDDKKEPELTAKKRYFFKPGWAYIFSHGSLGYFLSWWELENLENSSVWKHWRAFKAVRICGAKILRKKKKAKEKSPAFHVPAKALSSSKATTERRKCWAEL